MAASGATGVSTTRVSLWAAASLLCGVGLLPPFGILAIVLGIAGVMQTRRPGYTGRRAAIAGIVLGVLGTSLTLGAAVWWNGHARQPMLAGPREAVERGMAGDIDAFRAAFVAGDRVPREDAVAFIDALRDRYGPIVRSSLDPDEIELRDPVDRLRPRLPYLFVFEHETIGAEAVFVVFDGSSPRPVLAFEEFVVHDAQRGDLAYPQQP